MGRATVRFSRFFFINQSIANEVSPAANELPVTLSDYYAYYDRLVADWLDELNDIAEPFMPEPWWGWTPDSDAPLHAVVINLNPGVRGEVQTRHCMRRKLGNCFSYRRAMTDRILPYLLPQTAAWHKNKRENPILTALTLLPGLVNIEPYSDIFSANTLCIELYPYHSVTFNDNVVRQYLAQDKRRFIQTLEFAAVAAERSSLGNTVLVRISKDRWDKLLPDNNLFNNEVKEYSVNEDISAKAAIYTLTNCSDKVVSNKLKSTKFICVWNPKGRNNFPSKLPELLTLLANEDVIQLNINSHK